MSFRILSVSFVLFLSAALTANAATVTSNSSSIGDVDFNVANDDLLQGLTPVISGNVNSEEGLNSNTDGTNLTDGVYGQQLVNNPGPNPQFIQIHNGVTLDFTLPTPATITDINTYSGWRDPGRVNQNYEILYKTTGNPTFTSLTSVNQNYSGGGPSNLEVLISDVNLSDVTELRFSFPSTQNGYVGYHELDVIGPAIPEPSTLLLAALGLLGLLGFGRRRRR